jgi:hypothetical protein
MLNDNEIVWLEASFDKNDIAFEPLFMYHYIPEDTT